MRQVRARTSIAVVLGTLMAIGVCTADPLLLAQPRGRPAAPKPKPPAKPDAGPEPTTTSDEAPAAPSSGVSAPVPLAGDAGSSPSQAQTIPSYYDGGQKPSPLNPAPNELPGNTPPPGGTTVDYDKLLGDISTLRARVASVGDNLFHSRITITVQAEGDHSKIARLSVALDDGVVFAPTTSSKGDTMKVYEHSVAPGRHAVTIDVERKDEKDETFRTTQRSRMVVDVPKDEHLTLEVRIIDDSTMGADFPGDRSGRYDLRVRAKAVSRPVGK
jgi:hypothetical protein